jgi:hypothetical protein
MFNVIEKNTGKVTTVYTTQIIEPSNVTIFLVWIGRWKWIPCSEYINQYYKLV